MPEPRTPRSLLHGRDASIHSILPFVVCIVRLGIHFLLKGIVPCGTYLVIGIWSTHDQMATVDYKTLDWIAWIRKDTTKNPIATIGTERARFSIHPIVVVLCRHCVPRVCLDSSFSVRSRRLSSSKRWWRRRWRKTRPRKRSRGWWWRRNKGRTRIGNRRLGSIVWFSMR